MPRVSMTVRGPLLFAVVLSRMPLLWIASFIDGKGARMRLSGKRHRQPRSDALASETAVDKSESSRCIQALAMVSAGSAYLNSLTPWPAEAWAAFQWHSKPRDAFTLHVQAIFKLHEPVVTYEVENGEGMVTQNPRYRQPLFIPHLPRAHALLGHAGEQEASVETVCRQWGGGSRNDETLVLQNLPGIALSPEQADNIMAGTSSNAWRVGVGSSCQPLLPRSPSRHWIGLYSALRKSRMAL